MRTKPFYTKRTQFSADPVKVKPSYSRNLQRKKRLVNQKQRTQNPNKTQFQTSIGQGKGLNRPGEKVKKLAIRLYIAIITGITTDGRRAKILDCNDNFANNGVQRLDYGRS